MGYYFQKNYKCLDVAHLYFNIQFLLLQHKNMKKDISFQWSAICITLSLVIVCSKLVYGNKKKGATHFCRLVAFIARDLLRQKYI